MEQQRSQNNVSFILLVAVCICLICVALYSFYNVAQFDVNAFNEIPSELFKFYTDFRFEPPPSTINVDGTLDCLGETTCKVDDETTCFGCKSLLASCVHIDEDTTIIDSNGDSVVLEKNETENDGYCLQIKSADRACSRHGRLCLVQTKPNALDYTLLCICNNPGLIGNASILGNCTTVYMCNGEIDDISKDIYDINCICDASKISVKTEDNKISHCIDKTILDDISEVFYNHISSKNYNTVDTSLYDSTISYNTPDAYPKLIDPCSVCPVTGKKLDAHLQKVTDDDYICVENFNGSKGTVVLIADDNANGNILQYKQHGANVALGIKWRYISFYVGQSNKIDAFYSCEKKDNPDWPMLFGDKELVEIKAGANIIGFNILCNIPEFTANSCLYIEIYKNNKWDSYIVQTVTENNGVDYFPGVDGEMRSVKYVLRSHCPASFASCTGYNRILRTYSRIFKRQLPPKYNVRGGLFPNPDFYVNVTENNRPRAVGWIVNPYGNYKLLQLNHIADKEKIANRLMYTGSKEDSPEDFDYY